MWLRMEDNNFALPINPSSIFLAQLFGIYFILYLTCKDNKSFWRLIGSAHIDTKAAYRTFRQ